MAKWKFGVLAIVLFDIKLRIGNHLNGKRKCNMDKGSLDYGVRMVYNKRKNV